MVAKATQNPKTEVVEDEEDPWKLESGLPNDVDAIMANCRFGVRDQYMQQIVAGGAEGSGLMFLCDLVDENGELLGTQGWSVGSGWHAEDDGATLVHAARKNVVSSSRYGQLQQRVVGDLGVPMKDYGTPTTAATWNGLSFHWMLEGHETLKEVEGKRETKQGLMPTIFNGVNEAIREGSSAPSTSSASVSSISAELDTKLAALAKTNTYINFAKAAIRLPGVSESDELVAHVMDDGPDGYYMKHH